MNDGVARLLDAARNDLASARYLIDGDFPSQAASRAYYAAFHAAEAALLALGETRGKHSAVIAAFGRLVVKGGGADPATAGWLRDLFDFRARADYGGATTSEEARAALERADRFIAAVEAWVSSTG